MTLNIFFKSEPFTFVKNLFSIPDFQCCKWLITKYLLFFEVYVFILLQFLKNRIFWCTIVLNVWFKFIVYEIFPTDHRHRNIILIFTYRKVVFWVSVSISFLWSTATCWNKMFYLFGCAKYRVWVGLFLSPHILVLLLCLWFLILTLSVLIEIKDNENSEKKLLLTSRI